LSSSLPSLIVHYHHQIFFTELNQLIEINWLLAIAVSRKKKKPEKYVMVSQKNWQEPFQMALLKANKLTHDLPSVLSISYF
jgi:hypothetical protein